jgi:hypothetical protein
LRTFGDWPYATRVPRSALPFRPAAPQVLRGQEEGPLAVLTPWSPATCISTASNSWLSHVTDGSCTYFRRYFALSLTTPLALVLAKSSDSSRLVAAASSRTSAEERSPAGWMISCSAEGGLVPGRHGDSVPGAPRSARFNPGRRPIALVRLPLSSDQSCA